MTFAYPLDIPLKDFSEVEVESVDINSMQSSTFTGIESIQEFEGDYWKINLRYLDLNEELGRKVSAFVFALRRSVGTFVVNFPGYGGPRGSASQTPSSPQVDGTGQAGKRFLNIKNATPSITQWLLAGDIIQVGPDSRPHWHMALQDVTTDATGRATIDVWPALRASIADNDVVILDEPLGIFLLSENTRIPIRPPIIYDSISLQCREATRL